MTASPSEPQETAEVEDPQPEGADTPASVESEASAEAAADAEPDAAALEAAAVAEMLGAASFTSDHGTIKVRVGSDGWVAAHETLKGDLPYFSWLSAIDWAAEVAVGDPPTEAVEDRFEVLSCIGSVADGRFVILSTDLPKDQASLPSLVGVYGGAEWHEREAHEMFGILFDGHPNLAHLYLPDQFEGHPLLKSYPLLSREVKPWPGTVDVEDMPSTENPEAGDEAAGEGGEE